MSGEQSPNRCLAALCAEPAAYDVLMIGEWWWPECVEHTADMRAGLSNYVLAVESHDPNRQGQVAPTEAMA